MSTDERWVSPPGPVVRLWVLAAVLPRLGVTSAELLCLLELPDPTVDDCYRLYLCAGALTRGARETCAPPCEPWSDDPDDAAAVLLFNVRYAALLLYLATADPSPIGLLEDGERRVARLC